MAGDRTADPGAPENQGPTSSGLPPGSVDGSQPALAVRVPANVAVSVPPNWKQHSEAMAWVFLAAFIPVFIKDPAVVVWLKGHPLSDALVTAAFCGFQAIRVYLKSN